jgi:hypothetical protein
MSYFLAFGKIIRMQSLNGELLELLKTRPKCAVFVVLTATTILCICVAGQPSSSGNVRPTTLVKLC